MFVGACSFVCRDDLMTGTPGVLTNGNGTIELFGYQNSFVFAYLSMIEIKG